MTNPTTHSTNPAAGQRRRRRLAASIAAGVLLAAVPLACSDGEAAEPSTPDETTPSTTAAPAETIEVEAVDYAFEGLPSEIDAGTKLSLVNHSNTELHELVAFRLPDDETRSVEELMKLPPAELQQLMAGQPAAVLLAPPHGDQIEAIGDGTLDEPGRYAIICAIPTGVDPATYLEAAKASPGGPPDVPGGPPHIVAGMYGEVTVR